MIAYLLFPVLARLHWPQFWVISSESFISGTLLGFLPGSGILCMIKHKIGRGGLDSCAVEAPRGERDGVDVPPPPFLVALLFAPPPIFSVVLV